MSGPGEGFGMGPGAQKRRKNKKNVGFSPVGKVTLVACGSMPLLVLPQAMQQYTSAKNVEYVTSAAGANAKSSYSGDCVKHLLLCLLALNVACNPNGKCGRSTF